jgi:hypothetical protein
MSPAFVLNSTFSVIGPYQTTRRIGYFLFQHSEQIGECTHLANVQPEALTTPVRYHELLLNLILICNFDARILPESSDESTPSARYGAQSVGTGPDGIPQSVGMSRGIYDAQLQMILNAGNHEQLPVISVRIFGSFIMVWRYVDAHDIAGPWMHAHHEEFLITYREQLDTSRIVRLMIRFPMNSMEIKPSLVCNVTVCFVPFSPGLGEILSELYQYISRTRLNSSHLLPGVRPNPLRRPHNIVNTHLWRCNEH